MQNGKHAVARGLTSGFGFGTTEFHVLRPGPLVMSDWIHQFVRQPVVLRAAAAHFSGAVGQQRVPAQVLSAVPIPVPPLSEQRRITLALTEQLTTIERARTAAGEQLKVANDLATAILLAVFGGREAKQWPKRRLGDILTLRKEVVHPRDNPTGGSIFVGLEHVQSVTGRLLGSVGVDLAKLSGRKPRFYEGDIVYGYLSASFLNWGTRPAGRASRRCVDGNMRS